MNTPALSLDGLSVGYHVRRALHRSTSRTIVANITATARRGELTVLLGPNGSGKSTLLRTVCGLQPALAGSLTLDGNDVRRMPADELARAIAVVLTDRVDPGILSARELAGLGRTPHLGLGGRMSVRDHAVVARALEAVGATHLADRPAGELSDGERQRVLTARALAQEPALLVLDEPTAFLDVPSRVALVELLRSTARLHDLAVVMSTHDLELALRVADHVWLVDSSGRLTTGTPESLALEGLIGEVFDSRALRFDVGSGVFALTPTHGSPQRVRLRAPEPTASALTRMLGREGATLVADSPADLIVDARGPLVVHHGGQRYRIDGIDALPRLLRTLPPTVRYLTKPSTVTATMTELASVSPYFALTSETPCPGDRYPVGRLYHEADTLAEAIAQVGTRIGATEYRVAASTMFLGFAARLWSSTVGGIVRGGFVPDLAAEELLWLDDHGRIALHIDEPPAWAGGDLAALAREFVLDRHLQPLVTAIRALEPMSERLLWGNAASALTGAARALDGETRTTATQVALAVLRDPRLAGTVEAPSTGFRRRSCCLFYRTPASGYCGDCALTRPRTPAHQKEEST